MRRLLLPVIKKRIDFGMAFYFLSTCFCLALFYSILLILVWCYSAENVRLYISQMNDVSYKGSMIITVLALTEVFACAIAIVCRSYGPAIMRIFVILCLAGLLFTNSSTHSHYLIFVYSLIASAIIIGIGVFDIFPHKSKYCGILLSAILLVVVCLSTSYGPVVQKSIILLFLMAESLIVFVGLPYEVKFVTVRIRDIQKNRDRSTWTRYRAN